MARTTHDRVADITGVPGLAPAEHARPVVSQTEDFGVLVGWTHHDGPQGINLGLQSARSQAAWAAREIDRRNFLLTRNQALLLARYLLEATGQQLDAVDRPLSWRAVFSRIRGRRR